MAIRGSHTGTGRPSVFNMLAENWQVTGLVDISGIDGHRAHDVVLSTFCEAPLPRTPLMQLMTHWTT